MARSHCTVQHNAVSAILSQNGTHALVVSVALFLPLPNADNCQTKCQQMFIRSVFAGLFQTI